MITSPTGAPYRVAVVIPAYRVREHILGVLSRIGPEADGVYVVDDACPEQTGALVRDESRDPRVEVITHEKNLGVGAAVKTGYRAAVAGGHDVIVKIDGDGQMDPALLRRFVQPVISGRADYTKGNRFFNPEDVKGMPKLRVLGNAILSFLSKASSGYWQLFDSTNGYTAINARVVGWLPLDKIANRFFFESDVLFRLGTLRAVVVDIPMVAVYSRETSNLRVTRIFLPFIWGHLRAFVKRLFYNYFLRNFSVASVELVLGLLLLIVGIGLGVATWANASAAGRAATSGQVMLAALPILIGVQMLLSFVQYDVAATPSVPLTQYLPRPSEDEP